MIDYNADYEQPVQPDQGMCLHEGCGKTFVLGVTGSNDRCLEHAGAASPVPGEPPAILFLPKPPPGEDLELAGVVSRHT